MSLTIDYGGLEVAMSHYDPAGEVAHYFDTRTGEVLPVGDWVEGQARQLAHPDETDDPVLRLAWALLWSDGELDVDLPPVEPAALAEWADAYRYRFLRVPSADSREGYQEMVAFADTITDPHLQALLEVALQGSSAFRRFKDLLARYPEERQRWFAFHDQRLRQRVVEWLRGADILPAEESEHHQASPQQGATDKGAFGNEGIKE